MSLPRARSASEEAPEDLAQHLHREHTRIDMLGAGWLELASMIERSEVVDIDRVRDGVELHRAFVVGVHQRKEDEIGERLGRLPEGVIQDAWGRCRSEHRRTEQAGEELRALLGRFSFADAVARTELATALRNEANRMMEHHHSEEETLLPRLADLLPAAKQAELWRSWSGARGVVAAEEARLAAWVSAMHPASD